MSIHEIPHQGSFSPSWFPWSYGARSESSSLPALAQKPTGKDVTPLVSLVTNGVGEGVLVMTTVFCHSHKGKVVPLVVLLTLFQWDLPESGVVVVKIFVNLPYIPWVLLASSTWM